MTKLKKYGLNKLNEMLLNPEIHNQIKAILKSIKHNSEKNNMSVSDMVIFKIILRGKNAE